jgi:SynChlorMet cassette protein ScmD
MNTKNLVANPTIVLRKEFDDWAVLFNPDTAEAVGVNPIGVVIWELLTGKNSLEDITHQVKQNYSDVPGSAAKEIQTYIEDLMNRGFIGSESHSVR